MSLILHLPISQFGPITNTQREVLGVVILDLTMGSFEKSMDFQVIDIPLSFNLLLGRPWIHSLVTSKG